MQLGGKIVGIAHDDDPAGWVMTEQPRDKRY